MHTYDKVGRVKTTTDATGAVTTVSYDPNGNIIKLTQADGNEIIYTYNARNELTSYVDAAGYTHSYAYDGNGNVVSETDGNGNTTVYTYDGLNRVIGAKNADNGVSGIEYDADGRQTKVTDEEGAITAYTYDKDGRITAITDALGNQTTFTYDEMDRVLTTTDAKGGVTTYTYTNRGEVATKTDAENYVTSYEYDGNGNCVKMTTVDGDTVYTYDALDRLIGTVTPDGKSETFTYDGVGNITSSTDKNGNTTSYVYDGAGNVVETIDALGNSALFTYDSMGNLISTKLHRVDTQDGVDEWEITTYEFDGRGLTTKQMDALGNVTTYAYDGNGNLKSKTDADGYTTEYTYNALDLVTSINYNDTKNVAYRYNATGDLISMTDWLGTTTFEVDLLHQLKSATDHKGKTVTYDYDAVGNQTAIHYPDDTTATYDYDLVKNQTKVTETDGSETTYSYDGMGRVTEMHYPNGWVEYYTYDSMGRILAVNDTHPSEKPAKTQKHTYQYDANGNMTYEYMRGNGTGQAKNETLYTYDALNRLVTAHDNYGNSTRTYTYDSLGNLTFETGNGSHNMDYRYNNLNQIVDQSDDGWKTHTASTYDNRGNLTQETYTKNKKVSVVGAYVFDETNKMVSGTNDIGEQSIYAYNGLGALMENTWIIKKNAYGYHDVSATLITEGEVVVDSDTGKKQSKEKKTTEEVAASAELNKTSTVVKQFVVDFTSDTYKPLTEHEVNGLDYRYVYSDKARLSVVVQGIENGSASLLDDAGELHAYYHCDYLGTTDYLTSAVNSKVISWTSYNEWGEITHNAVLKCGQRELDLVKEYATHDFDAVLNMYYAKARFYDADNRHFTAQDPILDPSGYDIGSYAKDPMMLVQYLYVKDNAVNAIDPLGLMNYFTQGDNLLAGVGRNLVGQVKDAFNVFGSIEFIVELGKGLFNGDISLLDIGKILFSSLVGPWQYCITNIALLNPFDYDYSDDEVEEYGENLGSVLTDVVGFLIGANAAKLTNYLSKTATGQKLLKIINAAEKVGNVSVGRMAIKAIDYFDDLACHKVWGMSAFDRGVAIDNAFNNLGRYFPVVDRLEDGILTSVKSIDLTKPTYQSESKLLSTLKGYINSLDNAEQYSQVKGLSYSSKELLLAIPDVDLTNDQINALNRLYEYASGKNIAISIKVVK